MKKILFIICLFCTTTNIFAQRTADQILKFEKNIDDIVQNPVTGVIVIKEGSTVRGINPDSNTEVWSFDITKGAEAVLGDIASIADLSAFTKDKRNLKAVDNTPYVEAIINSQTVVINTETGQVVFNSSKLPFYVFDMQFLYGDNEYLVKGKAGKDIVVSLIDLKTGMPKWQTPTDNASSFLSGMMSIKGAKNISNEGLVVENTIYSLYYGKLTAINRTTGAIMWKAEEEYSKLFPTQNKKNLIVIQNDGGLISTKQLLNVLDNQTGKSIWEESIKTKAIVYLEDWGDKLLVAHWKGFNFFNLKDGSKIWKKDARGDGLKKVIPIDKDYLYVAENEMMLINKDGEKLWKKFIEISDEKEDAIVYLGKVNNKVMYITATYGNMVDYVSGQKLWKRNLKFNEKRPTMSVYDEEAKSFLVYNDEELYKFDPSVADKPDPFAKVNIKREKELNGMELFPWGVALSGPLEVVGVGKDGQTKYHRNYSQPGELGRQMLKGLGRVAQVAGGIASTEIKVSARDANGNEVTGTANFGNDVKAAGIAGSIAGGALAAATRKRFNAMKQNQDYSFIFAKDEASDTKVLVKVRKADGEEVDKIIFENNRPDYEIDPLTESIYYIIGNHLKIFLNKK